MKMTNCNVQNTLELEDKCIGLTSNTAISMQTIEKTSLVLYLNSSAVLYVWSGMSRKRELIILKYLVYYYQ